MGEARSISTRVGDHVRRNLVGYLALFVALSGTAWAANKVTSSEIAKNAVLSKHLKTGQVKGVDVADDGLTGADVAEASLGAVPRALSADSAGSAESADSAQSAQSAQSAASAETLDGLNSTDFLGKTEQAADADKVDGADQCRAGVLTLPAATTTPAPGTALCQFGGGRIEGFCYPSGGSIRGDIWVPDSSALVYGAATAGFTGGGGGTFALLVAASDAPGGGATRSNAIPFYLATEAGQKIAGVAGTRSSATSTTEGSCDIIVSATS